MSRMTMPNPSTLHRYRDETENQRPMPGATMPSFKCPRCRQFRKTQGRKKIGGRWRCAQCVEQLKQHGEVK